jgi:hypothetical protein
MQLHRNPRSSYIYHILNCNYYGCKNLTLFLNVNDNNHNTQINFTEIIKSVQYSYHHHSVFLLSIHYVRNFTVQ